MGVLAWIVGSLVVFVAFGVFIIDLALGGRTAFWVRFRRR